jgi:hypothetical protein
MGNQAMVYVANCNQPGENGRHPSLRSIRPTGAAESSPTAREDRLVVYRQVRWIPATSGRARHRKETAPSWPELLGAIFSDWGWTLRAAFITGEILCAGLGGLALATRCVAAGTGVFGTEAAALIAATVARRRNAK